MTSLLGPHTFFDYELDYLGYCDDGNATHSGNGFRGEVNMQLLMMVGPHSRVRVLRILLAI